MLTKNVPVVVKATAANDTALEEGQFTALASVFNNIDAVGDMVLPGAFSDTLDEWKSSGASIPVYWSHRMDDPFQCIGQVLEAEETDTGLQVKAALDLDNPNGAQVYRLLKGARVNRMSFAYDVLEGAWVEQEEKSYFELRKLKLHEVSVVQVPANDEAAVQSVKRRTKRSRANRAKAIEDNELAGLVGQADQAIDDAADALADADAAMDAIVTEAAGEGAADPTCVKTGRVLSAKNEKTLRTALDKLSAAGTDIKAVLAALEDSTDDSNDGKASPAQPATAEAPPEGKASEPARSSPASFRLRANLAALAAEFDTD